MASTSRPSTPLRDGPGDMQAEQEHNPEQEETVEQETVEQEQTAEQKHEHVIAASYSLLSAQLAFAEAGERDIAGRVAGMGEFMFGPESFSKRVSLLDGRAPIASSDQVRQVKLEEAQNHLIDTWKVFLEANLDGKAERLFDFAQGIYGKERWAMALHRSS